MNRHCSRFGLTAFVFCTTAFSAVARDAAGLTYQTGANVPDAGSSVLRVFGALVLVTAIFLGGVWLYRNWQRLAARKHGAPRLNVFEVRSLGQRQALYVVGYEQQRMLLASSPAGVTLVSHLPAAEESAAVTETVARPTFVEAFQRVLSRKA